MLLATNAFYISCPCVLWIGVVLVGSPPGAPFCLLPHEHPCPLLLPACLRRLLAVHFMAACSCLLVHMCWIHVLRHYHIYRAKSGARLYVFLHACVIMPSLEL
jgi:hypothetical protein